jgi:hypothetical protein
MGFFHSTPGKIIVICLGVVALVAIAFFIKGNVGKSGTDSPSDVTNLLPKSDPNDPNRVERRPGDAVGVMPSKPD